MCFCLRRVFVVLLRPGGEQSGLRFCFPQCLGRAGWANEVDSSFAACMHASAEDSDMVLNLVKITENALGSRPGVPWAALAPTIRPGYETNVELDFVALPFGTVRGHFL